VAFSKEILSTSTCDYNLRRNYWNDAFGAQLYTWILQKILDEKYPESFKMGCF